MGVNQDYKARYESEQNKNEILLNNFHSVQEEIESLRNINSRLATDINVLMIKYIQILEENAEIYKNKVQELLKINAEKQEV